MTFIVYILFSESKNRFYIGYSGDSIHERLRKHNSNHKGFTGSFADWKVVYIESYSSKQEAILREKEIKKWKSRKLIQKLVSQSSADSVHPD